jgi:isopentenyldiphosphate isomerase
MTEQTIIVDEGDKQIGIKDRSEICLGDICRSSGLWIENSKGQVLLAKRTRSRKVSPGRWGPAASGTLEEGESYEQNIYKEAEEEIGLKGCKFKEFIYGRFDHSRFTKIFKLKSDIDISNLVLQKEEVDSVAWFDPEDLRKRIKSHPEEFVESALKWEEIGLL